MESKPQPRSVAARTLPSTLLWDEPAHPKFPWNGLFTLLREFTEKYASVIRFLVSTREREFWRSGARPCSPFPPGLRIPSVRRGDVVSPLPFISRRDRMRQHLPKCLFIAVLAVVAGCGPASEGSAGDALDTTT